ncbi:MAG: hypothetical protein AABY09_01990 [Nanoarchaeota archaeon]
MAEHKGLNILDADSLSMARTKLKGEELTKAIREAQKDPKFVKEIHRFIKVTTR